MKWKNVSFPLIITIFIVVLAGCQSLSSIVKQDTLVKKPKAYIYQNRKPVQHISAENNIQSKISEYLISHHVNGSVAVLKNNKLIFNEGVGYSNFKSGIENQPLTTYPIGSITKAFVATSIMQLQEKGKLNIFDPVSKYISHFPNGKRIKLIHLLSHTSGIQKPIWHVGDQQPQDLIREIERRPVIFRPGTKWNYQDANYMVLGYIVEKVTGKPLNDYIQKNIFDKGNMQNSGFITERDSIPYNTVGYSKYGQQLIPVKRFNTSLLFGCGSIYLTAYDLSLFDQSLQNGKFVTKKSLKEMLIPRSKSKYGFGLYNYGNVIFSRGVLSGFEAIHGFYKDKTSIAILLNVRDKKVNIHKTLEDIHKIVSIKKHLTT